MVQAKGKKKMPKANPKKQSIQGKKNGKHTNNAEFASQLEELGLKIVPLIADGNCFFRGIADQLEGNEEEHAKYRHMVVEYIKKHRVEFEPFIEDDVPFDEYCQSMENDSTWAGHMEIQAASLVCQSNICIHRSMSPRWYIKNFPDNETRMIHLSYHDGEHYNSVRTKEDPCDGPARPVIIKADVEISALNQDKTSVKNAKSQIAGKTTINPSFIKIVMSGSGSTNPEEVERTVDLREIPYTEAVLQNLLCAVLRLILKVLQEVHGNVDAAIEFLLAKGTDEIMEDADQTTTGNDSTVCASDFQNVTCEEFDSIDLNVSVESTNLRSLPRKDPERDGNVSHIEQKKIPRNKLCPCGSRKKYKACCGSAEGRSLRIEMNQKVVSNKMRKEQSRQGKTESHSRSPLVGSDSGKLDMGALCI